MHLFSSETDDEDSASDSDSDSENDILTSRVFGRTVNFNYSENFSIPTP